MTIKIFVNTVKTVFFLSILIFFSSCGNKCKDLNKIISQSIMSNNDIDEDEWNNIIIYLEKNKENINKCNNNLFDGDKVDEGVLFDYIKSFLSERRHADEFNYYRPTDTIARVDVKINFYIENSGSMFGYVKGNTKFEDVLYDLLVLIKDSYEMENLTINFVNTEIHAVEEPEIDEFIKELNPSSINIGDVSSSNLNNIFKLILKEHDDNEISIFVSDCIYSVFGNDTEGSLQKEEYATKDAFLVKFKDFNVSTFVAKYMSDFSGKYWDKDNRSVYLKKQERPFYIWFIGNDALLLELSEEILKFTDKDYENSLFFSPQENILIEKMQILGTTLKEGKFKKDRNLGYCLTDTKPIKRGDKKGRFQFAIAINIDTNSLFYDRQRLLDSNNYIIDSDDDFTLEIKLFSDISLNQNDKITLQSENFNFVYVLSTNSFLSKEQNVNIKLVKKIPEWIKTTTIIDDKDIKNNLDKTFGFSYLINGIWGAYAKKFPENENLIEINIKLEK